MIVDGHLPSFPDFHGTETEQELDLSYWPGLLRLCQICEDARSGSCNGTLGSNGQDLLLGRSGWTF